MNTEPAPSSYRAILRLALPAIVSNVTVPLLSLVDTAIVGHIAGSALLGAIAVGGTIFSVAYWVFGFLRASTSGFASQALGRGDRRGVAEALVRAQVFGLLISLVLICAQSGVLWVAYLIVAPSAEVGAWAAVYFRLLIWGAPAVMLLYGLNGWFIGLQNTRMVMLTAVAQNVVNIALSLLFVIVLGWGLRGVALGTLIAQYAGLLIAGTFALRLQRRHRLGSALRDCLGWTRLCGIVRHSGDFFRVNRDIFLRTLCILGVTTWFTASGARQGDVTLASNALLLQLFYLFSFFMDGFANAGEALAGLHFGARNRRAFDRMLRDLFRLGCLLAAAFTVLYALLGLPFLGLLTDDAMVLSSAAEARWWAVVVPSVSFAAFLWDGVFIGLTATRPLLWSMVLSTAVYFALCLLLTPSWGNDGLWTAFLSYLLTRGLCQTYLFKLK